MKNHLSLKCRPKINLATLKVIVGLLYLGCLLTGCEFQAPDDNKLISNNDDPLPDLCSVPVGQPASATYTVEWEATLDDDLEGYRLYFGNEADMNKNNVQGWFDISRDSTDTRFSPATYEYKTCDEVYIAITSLGNRPESVISEVMQITVH